MPTHTSNCHAAHTSACIFSRVTPNLITPRLELPRRPTTEIKHIRTSQSIPIDTRVEPPRRSPHFSTNATDSWLDVPAQRTRSKSPSFRSVAQEAMLSCAKINQFQLSTRSLASRRFPVEMLNAVLNKETGELMEYLQVRKCPKYRKLCAKSYSK